MPYICQKCPSNWKCPESAAAHVRVKYCPEKVFALVRQPFRMHRRSLSSLRYVLSPYNSADPARNVLPIYGWLELVKGVVWFCAAVGLGLLVAQL